MEDVGSICRVAQGYPDRRAVLAGLASLAVTGPSLAADASSPIAHGALANNLLAQAFEAAPPELPDVTLVGPNGERNISELKGRTLLMPLWAEWCAPCLGEIPDFARLQEKYGNASFAIVPILTGARKKLTPDTTARLFGYLHASVFEPLIEKDWGRQLMAALARKSVGAMEIPCNLLIAPDGHVVAREFGLKSVGENGSSAEMPGGSSNMIARAEAGDSLSLWGKDAGAEFAAAMASGFLTQG